MSQDASSRPTDDVKRCRDLSSPTYPFDFSIFKEGEFEPLIGKTIRSLIASNCDYIVFLDEEWYVQWDMNEDEQLTRYGEALTRVAILESIQVASDEARERDLSTNQTQH